ncbi:MAG: efflux RND transporter periplasmic adaptor subunit [Planctomycetes bacterium]|nr:efflux RND transporter periplasmic adaptor subunit [Planctomycetota bacterium]
MPTTVLLLVLSAVAGGSAAEQPGDQIEIASALIKLVEQVDVPAREAGVLASVEVVEGRMVEEGELLARIVDTEARFAEATAKGELEIARKKSENDINTRYAKKSVEVAKAELARSMESIEQYAKSISESEMDRLRLLVERAILEVEQSERELEIAEFTQQIRQSEHEAAKERVQRHRITAPLGGVVVQVNRRRGEWVEPGEMVMRILRLDRLRAEGFLNAQYLRHDLQDWQVKLTVDLPGEPGAEFPGTVVFLSPEIDPVNSQISIWVEIDNEDLRLRPGMRAKMTIVVPPPKP